MATRNIRTTVAFLLKFGKLLVKFHPSDAQSIAVTRQA